MRKKYVKSLNASKMAKRIRERNDNVYDEKVIQNILNMYMDECYQALLKGERVQLTKVGTIIPEVKSKLSFNLPICNKEGGNPPYTKLRIYRNYHLCDAMNRLLIKNIKNGIYGLEKLPFSKKQMDILKNRGYIPEDAIIDDEVIEDAEILEDMEE